MKQSERLFGAVIALLALAPVCLVQTVQSPYPGKPVRVVLPVAAGGGIDIVGRLLGAKLSDEFKLPFAAAILGDAETGSGALGKDYRGGENSRCINVNDVPNTLLREHIVYLAGLVKEAGLKARQVCLGEVG